MSKAEAKKIVKKYAKKLKAEKYPFSAIYLFGSFAKGTPRKWSDIDVAVVSKELNKRSAGAELKLWKFREGIDDRIEPHGFSPEDFKDYWNPMAHEIKKTGIRVV
ncbi:MAG: nucleotidyltransferase domain-containing protein [Parcubacteria group bacterium]|nr:nucleotidyltransferase domain-containing protein [Parcubacteria group bacterium]